MFNPYCRETKGCFNPTVRGEGEEREGQGRDVGGGVVGVLEGWGWGVGGVIL